jgi:hypothetical protein
VPAATLDDFATSSNYQPVSRLAVAGLALGIASLIVFLAPPVSIIVPVAALVVSIAATIRIRRDASLAGAGLARVALFLALFTLSAGCTHWSLRVWHLRRTAEQVGEQFVARLLAGDARAAPQMTLEPSRRFATDRPHDDGYLGSAAARDELAKFTEDPLVKRLQSLHGDTISKVTVEWHESRSKAEQFGVLVVSASGLEIRLLVEQRRTESSAGWIVTSYSLKP